MKASLRYKIFSFKAEKVWDKVEGIGHFTLKQHSFTTSTHIHTGALTITSSHCLVPLKLLTLLIMYIIFGGEVEMNWKEKRTEKRKSDSFNHKFGDQQQAYTFV